MNPQAPMPERMIPIAATVLISGESYGDWPVAGMEAPVHGDGPDAMLFVTVGALSSHASAEDIDAWAEASQAFHDENRNSYREASQGNLSPLWAAAASLGLCMVMDTDSESGFKAIFARDPHALEVAGVEAWGGEARSLEAMGRAMAQRCQSLLPEHLRLPAAALRAPAMSWLRFSRSADAGCEGVINQWASLVEAHAITDSSPDPGPRLRPATL